jgi:cell fate (sporulation/competence/biofilm development) regulator YlbF (YheA/YmcA/DUF963 family)
MVWSLQLQPRARANRMAPRPAENPDRSIMETITENDTLIQKTKDLCQVILDRPDFAEIKRQMDEFMNDELAKHQFQLLSQKGNILQTKQQHGMPMVESEITEFQRMRDELMANPVAKGFFDAQDRIQQVHTDVLRYLNKTFELGRMPTEEDFNDGSCCDSGCGCEH